MVDLRRRFHILPCLSLRNLRESFGRLGRWEKKKKGVGMKGEGKVQSCLLLIAFCFGCSLLSSTFLLEILGYEFLPLIQ